MGSDMEKKYESITIMCIAAVVLERLCSLGIGTMVLIVIIPIHSFIFSKTNSKVTRIFKKSSNYKIGFWVSCISFVLAYICLPDYTNIDSSLDAHAFFGMITDMDLLEKMHDFSLLCFLLNVVSMAINWLLVKDAESGKKK